MRVVVTGGTGHIGKFILSVLREAGHEVVNVDRKRPEGRRSWTHVTDLNDIGQVYDAFAELRPEAVVHAAADPATGGKPRHPHFMGNVGIAHSVFLAATDFGVKRIVYLSSEQANGFTSAHLAPARFPFDETVMIPPRTAYALSKLLGETMLDSFVGMKPELSAVSLRVNAAWRPEDPVKALEWIRRNHEWCNPHFWAWIDPEDVAHACRLALAASIEGHRVYNLAAPDIRSFTPLRELMARYYPSVEIDESLGEFGSPVDTTRIRQELGWEAKIDWRPDPV